MLEKAVLFAVVTASLVLPSRGAAATTTLLEQHVTSAGWTAARLHMPEAGVVTWSLRDSGSPHWPAYGAWVFDAEGAFRFGHVIVYSMGTDPAADIRTTGTITSDVRHRTALTAYPVTPSGPMFEQEDVDLDAGVFVVAFQYAADSPLDSQLTLTAPDGTTVEEVRSGTGTWLRHSGDFEGETVVSVTTAGGQVATVQGGTARHHADRPVWGIFAMAPGTAAEIGYDAPDGSHNGRAHYTLLGTSSGDYTFRLEQALGVSHARLPTASADVRLFAGELDLPTVP